MVSDGEEEAHKKGLYLDGDRLEPSRDVHHWQIHAYDLNDGKELWMQEVHAGPPTNGRHLKNTYASETPVADENGVYVYFGNLGIFGFSHDGELLWERKLPAFDTTHAWGTGSSPVLHQGRIYIVHDNDQAQSYMVAIDAETARYLENRARFVFDIRDTVRLGERVAHRDCDQWWRLPRDGSQHRIRAAQGKDAQL